VVGVTGRPPRGVVGSGAQARGGLPSSLPGGHFHPWRQSRRRSPSL